jgi:hypothetical protein
MRRCGCDLQVVVAVEVAGARLGEVVDDCEVRPRDRGCEAPECWVCMHATRRATKRMGGGGGSPGAAPDVR